MTARSGTPVLSVHVDPVQASVGQTITATVSYRNVSAKPYRLVLEYNVWATDASGKVVFNSWARAAPRSQLTSTPKVIHLASAATSSGKVEFRLKAPGKYDVVAFTTNDPRLQTPPVRVVVSPQ